MLRSLILLRHINLPRFSLLALLIVSAGHECLAQDTPVCRLSRRATQACGLLPVSELPPFVPVPPDSVSLFADFDHADSAYVPIYLINATDSTLSVPSQDRQIYLKLETRDDQGNWVRAERHGYSWCGNSYYPVCLEPNQAMELRGYKPVDGEERPVRYRVYSEFAMASNAGVGLAAMDDFAACRTDPMFFRYASFETLAGMALDRTAERTEEVLRSRKRAIIQLGQHLRPETLVILALLSEDVDPEVSKWARDTLNGIYARNEFLPREGR